jgi:anthranilate phosphoribosyltransferase
MIDRILHHYLEEFRLGCDVEPAETETLFDALIDGDNEFLLTELLAAWNEKGITDDELFSFATVLRERMKRISSRHTTFVDTVGTGGSRAKTYNVSTAAAFVIAGTGVPVAKHGNRAATSRSGSSDVLSELGIDIDLEPAETEKRLNDHGLCFMFAPRFHSLSPTLAKARRALHRPTIFNNLGPLCNPASPPHKVIGVCNEGMIELTANVLARLGTVRSWVVNGSGGIDEISLVGRTSVAEIFDDKIRYFEVSAADFGIDPDDGSIPANCSPAESADIIRRVLNNELVDQSAEKFVLINAAAAIYVTGVAKTLPQGHEMAKNAIRRGSALEKLNILAGDRAK